MGFQRTFEVHRGAQFKVERLQVGSADPQLILRGFGRLRAKRGELMLEAELLHRRTTQTPRHLFIFPDQRAQKTALFFGVKQVIKRLLGR